MSAMGSGRAQRQRATKRRRTIRSAFMLRLATMAALSLAMALAARADDGRSQALTRLASAGGLDAQPWRLGLPARFADVDVDLKVLLAQNGPPAKTDVANGDDTMLVALALAVPQSVDDEIGRQYGLELIDRTELTDLGLRIVQFRAPANRAVEPILAELRNDQRIRRAQRNARYEMPTQSKPAPGVAAATPNAKVQASARRGPNGTPGAKLRRRLAGPVAVDERGTAPSVRPLRVGNVGDVLSGGL